MILTVPKDWKVESRVNEEGMTECVLTDAHSESTDPDIREHNVFYEHEIVITPYEVINLPESQLILVSQFMDYFEFESDKEELNGQIEKFIDEENGQAMLLWADETEFGNVVYIMYEDGLYDFYVCGYLISEESSQKLLKADFLFDPFVTVKERK